LNGNICCKCCKLLFALSVLHMSWAQETGSITGQVLDPGMASVGNAQITIKNEATGASFSTLSDQTGVYRAPELPPGVYTLTAELAGFRTLVREGIVVRVTTACGWI
jgi:hypothetical protein